MKMREPSQKFKVIYKAPKKSAIILHFFTTRGAANGFIRKQNAISNYCHLEYTDAYKAYKRYLKEKGVKNVN